MVSLSYQTMNKLLDEGSLVIEGVKAKSSSVQPNSIDVGPMVGDLRITELFNNRITDDYLSKWAPRRSSLSGSFVLETGKTYIIPGPNVEIPENYYVTAQPKSNTGRNGLNVEILPKGGSGNGITKANYLPSGYKGPTYLRVTPEAYPMELFAENPIHAPDKLNKVIQLRFREKNTSSIKHTDIKMLYGRLFRYYQSFYEDVLNKDQIDEKTFYEKAYLPRETVVSGDSTLLRADTQLILKQKKPGTSEPVVLREKKARIEDYWDIIINTSGFLNLEPNTLYLTCTKEVLDIGKSLCGEMAMKTTGLSPNIKTHDAGFFDSGFQGRITCEITNRSNAFQIPDGEFISEVYWEWVDEDPDVTYNGHFQKQIGPLPPRSFKNHDKIWDLVKKGDLEYQAPERVRDLDVVLGRRL